MDLVKISSSETNRDESIMFAEMDKFWFKRTRVKTNKQIQGELCYRAGL